MTTPAALRALADRCEREPASNQLNGDIAEALGLPPKWWVRKSAPPAETHWWRNCDFTDAGPPTFIAPDFTGSVDAALTLLPAGMAAEVDTFGNGSCWKKDKPQDRLHSGECPRAPAAALCAAILRARAKMMEDGK